VLIPIVTYLGPMIAYLMTGSFVIENLFAIPGIGRELINSIQGRDAPVVLGLTIFLGAFIVAMNLIVDLMLGLIDPRIKV
jgi:oligopeptide transport system permease protein